MAPPTIRKRLRLVAIALVAVVVGMGQVGPASAAGLGATANVQRARQHFLAGKRAFEDAHYPRALREFQDGYALEPRPGFLLNMGHTARRMGQLREARELYVRFLATRPPAAEERAASQMVAEIDRELSHGAPSTSVTPAPAAVEIAPAAVAPAAQAALAPPKVAVDPVSASAPAPVAPTSRPSLNLRAPATEVVAPPITTTATLAASTSAPRDGASEPIYRRWWFWAGAGAVAAGVLTAILVGSSGGSARDSGSWGQLKL